MTEYFGSDKTEFDLKILFFGMIAFLFLAVMSLSVSGEIYSVVGSRELTTSTDGNYAFMNENQFFQVYYGDNPASGNVVKIVKDGVEMSLLPMALNWNNDLSQLHQISMPQPVSPTIQGSDVIFTNAYGSGLHLMYETQGDKVKEKIIIDDFSDLLTPAQYVLDGGGVVLEVGFQLSTNAQHIEIDGVEWDLGSEVMTTNDVIVKNDQGEVLYTLPRPFAVDDNGVVSYGSYQFKKSANKLYVRMYFDYSFLQTATYPVVLDPTFIVDYSPIPAEHLQGGTNHNYTDAMYINIDDITTGVSDMNDATTYLTRGETLISSQQDFYLIQDDNTRDGQEKAENRDMGKLYTIPDPSLIQSMDICVHYRTRFDAPITNNVYIRIDNTQTTVALPYTTKDIWGTQCMDITSKISGLSAGSHYFGVTQPVNGDDWEIGFDQTDPDIGSYEAVPQLSPWVLRADRDYMIRLNYTLNEPLLTWSDYNTYGWRLIDDDLTDYTSDVIQQMDGLSTGNTLLQWGAGHYLDLHIDDGVLHNGDTVYIRVRTVQSTDYGKEVEFTNHLNTIEYGFFTMPLQSTTFEYRNITLSNIPPEGISHLVIHDSIASANIRVDLDLIHPYYDHIDVLGGVGISAHWNVTDDGLSDYWVKVKKTSPDTANVYILPYIGLTNTEVDEQLYITQSLAGTGWFNIPVSSLVDYQTNTEGYDYTNLRIWTDEPTYFSEIYLRAEADDTVPPVITDCSVNTTTLSCGESLLARCNVTDNLDVQDVNFTANGVVYQPTMNGDYWEYVFTPDYDGYTVYDWTDVDAQDIVGLTTNYDPNIQITYNCSYADFINIQHTGTPEVDIFNITETSAVIYWTTSAMSDSLVEYGLSPSNLNESEYDATYVTDHYVQLSNLIDGTEYFYDVTSVHNPFQTLGTFNFTTVVGCHPNWVEDPYTCQTDDTYFSTYTDTNACNSTENLPPTNGTYQYCNYCSEDLLQILGQCEEDGTQTVDYVDFNAITCCAVTDLISDCSIEYYPYNETTSQACLYFNNTMGDITCQNIPNINPREKEYCLAHIPNQYLNETFKCISSITSQETGEILQTNPEYRERSNSWFDFREDPETREYFAPANALVNFYYTDKNLQPEENYVLTIDCSSQQRTLSSSMLLEMRYEDYEFVFFRTKWLMENAGYVIAGIFMAFFILFVLLWIFKGVK